ncbi:LysR substrate-binding domain-containing protein [Micromonospora siamensis]|uniref:LysR substrate-binding domain-containing protein n=1 Tax=Micromonospora siamensis TaxID=299152 RepID=UPI001E4909CD
MHEHEPAEAYALLGTDDVDLALVYDYNLAPTPFDPAVQATRLWTAAWHLGVPAGNLTPGRSTAEDLTTARAAAARDPLPAPPGGDAAADGDRSPAPDAAAVFARFRDADWIVNSRNTADEVVVRTIASMAGFEPRIAHRADSLELVQDLIVAGLGVGLLPADQPTVPGVRLLPLTGPEALLRAYAVVRRGRAAWPPLALILDLLAG